MICSEAVNDTQVVPQGLLVSLGTQHGPDLHKARPGLDRILLTQEEVVRAHLACHLETLLFGQLDNKDLTQGGVEEEGKKINKCAYHTTIPYVV